MSRMYPRTIAMLVIFASLNLSAEDRPKLKVLPKAIEAQWIDTVKHHRTQDGATVAEVLAYVQKMRPSEFKTGSFDVGYNGADGEASGVYIGYWLGAKRLPGDSYVDLGYDMTPDGQVKPVSSDEVMTTALEGGRDRFLQAVDEAYTLDCHPDPDEKPDC